MKKTIISLISIIIVLLFLPMLLVNNVASDAGMIMILILFFTVNPMFTVIIGIMTAHSIKTMWYIPLILVVVYILSSWLLFDMFEVAFIVYGTIYLVLGYGTVAVTKIFIKFSNIYFKL